MRALVAEVVIKGKKYAPFLYSFAFLPADKHSRIIMGLSCMGRALRRPSECRASGIYVNGNLSCILPYANVAFIFSPTSTVRK